MLFVGSTITPLPPINDQSPVAGKINALPERDAVVCGRQRNWSAPAAAGAMESSKRKMLTESAVLAQLPLLMVHTKMFSPTASPVTCVLGEPAEVMTPDPCARDHVPVATPTGTLPERIASVVGVHSS